MLPKKGNSRNSYVNVHWTGLYKKKERFRSTTPSMSSRKRQRTSGVSFSRVARPIDKQIISIALTTDGSNQTTVLFPATFPATVVGLRWDINSRFNTFDEQATEENHIGWAIVVVPQGEVANNIGLADGSTFYAPEQNVMAAGIQTLGQTLVSAVGLTAANTEVSEGSTKAMRKLRGGDQLVYIQKANLATSKLDVFGLIQFFLKT